MLKHGDRVRFGSDRGGLLFGQRPDHRGRAASGGGRTGGASRRAETHRPSNFTNASPFQKKSREKDPVGMYIMLFAGDGGARLFIVALVLIFHPPAAGPAASAVSLEAIRRLLTCRRGAPGPVLKPMCDTPAWQEESCRSPYAKISAAARRRRRPGSVPSGTTRRWRVLFEAEARRALGNVDASATAPFGRRRSWRCFSIRWATGWAYFEVEINPARHRDRPRPAPDGQRLAEGFRVGRGRPCQPRATHGDGLGGGTRGAVRRARARTRRRARAPAGE